MKKVATIAERLREALDYAGKKQIDLALETDLNKSTVNRYVKGEIEPRSDAICKLATALSVSEMWLWGYDVPMECPVNLKINKSSHQILSENLCFYMAVQDKTRRDISDALAISYYTVTDWVNGKKMPRIDKLEMLAAFFGVSKTDLLEDSRGNTNAEQEKEDVVLTKLVTKLRHNSPLLSTVSELVELPEEHLTHISAIITALNK